MVVPSSDNRATPSTPPCPTCKRPMTLLFFSAACDFCEGKAKPLYDRGYVVYRGGVDGQLHEEYVFRSPQDAERWRTLLNMDETEVRVVYSEDPFIWRLSNGTVKDLELADHLYTIFPDRYYEPGAHRAHVGA